MADACRTTAMLAVAATAVVMAVCLALGMASPASFAGAMVFAALSTSDLLHGSRDDAHARDRDARAAYAAMGLAWCAGLGGCALGAAIATGGIAAAVALCACEME